MFGRKLAEKKQNCQTCFQHQFIVTKKQTRKERKNYNNNKMNFFILLILAWHLLAKALKAQLDRIRPQKHPVKQDI